MKLVNCGCGGEAKIDYVIQHDGLYMAGVFCANCGTKTIPFWSKEKDKAIDYAVTTWNKAMGITHERAVEYLQSTGWMQDHDRQMMTMGSIEKSSTVERTAKVETVEKPNVYKCSECGQYFHSTAWGSPVEYCSRCGCRLDWNEDIPMEYFESGGI